MTTQIAFSVSAYVWRNSSQISNQQEHCLAYNRLRNANSRAKICYRSPRARQTADRITETDEKNELHLDVAHDKQL